MSVPTAMPAVLESGDRLTRAEFHRRYCIRSDIYGPIASEHLLALSELVQREMMRHGSISITKDSGLFEA